MKPLQIDSSQNRAIEGANEARPAVPYADAGGQILRKRVVDTINRDGVATPRGTATRPCVRAAMRRRIAATPRRIAATPRRIAATPRSIAATPRRTAATPR